MDSINPLLNSIFATQTRVFLIVGALLLGLAEIGYRLGLRLHQAHDEPRSKQADIVQGAVLGLMSLLLGFTFAMASQRFDQRRNFVLQEANAIGTAFLRASFLPDAPRAESENLFRRYVALRLELMHAAATPTGLVEHEANVAKLQQRLWQVLIPVSRENPNALVNSYGLALNQLFDFDAIRLAAWRNHVPGAVWLLLLVLSSTGCLFTGYRAGTLGRRSKLPLIALPLLITVVITLVTDLDRPHVGLIGLDDTSLRNLQTSLGAAPPNP